MKRIAAFLFFLILISSLVPAFAAETDIQLYDYYAWETLPKIYIETENGVALNDASLVDPSRRAGTASHLPVYNYVDAAVSVRDCEGYEFEDASAQVKIRGNYTSSVPKHPVRIKFSEKHAMCGLNGGSELKSWVLLGEYNDASLLRNSAALYIANSLYTTTGNYASDFRNVEVYINGEYYGLYVLVEQQQVNKHRVDVPKPKDDYDVHTGYFIEYDGYYFNEDPSETFSIRYDRVTRPNGQTFLPTSVGNGEKSADDPSTRRQFGGIGGTGIGDTRETGFTIKSDTCSDEQRAFIQKVMQTIWDVLYDAVYGEHGDLNANPYHTMDGDGNYIVDASIKSTYDAVASVVDIDSLVDMSIIEELAQDGDLDWSSFFFSIDMSPEGDHRLTYTAPWDFDGAFTGEIRQSFVMNNDNPWFVLFCGQDWFWQRLNERWDAAAEAGVFTGVLDMLDTLTAVNADAYERNNKRWSSNSSRSGSREMGSREMGSGESAVTQAQAEKTLRSWLAAKIDTTDRMIDTMIRR